MSKIVLMLDNGESHVATTEAWVVAMLQAMPDTLRATVVEQARRLEASMPTLHLPASRRALLPSRLLNAGRGFVVDDGR